MKTRKLTLFGALAAFAVVAAACSGDFETDQLLGPTDAQMTETSRQYVQVYKFGPAGTYDFEASATGGDLAWTSFTVDAGSKAVIWSQPDPDAPGESVTVTEILGAGMQVDSIVVRYSTADGPVAGPTLIGTNTVTVDDLTYDRGAALKFYNSEKEMGMEGCTPGYWRQPQHFDSWVGYAPSDSFDDVFGVMYGGTLLDAVWAHGGGVDALARHSVAALLNASSDVDYPAGVSAVISAVQDAFTTGDYETQKDIFEGWNEAGCPLD